MIRLRFDRGSLLIEGELGTPYGRQDSRVGAFRAMALHYPDVLEYLDRSRLFYRDEVADPIPVPPLGSEVDLRLYQREALESWLDAGKRVIQLPTGARETDGYSTLLAIRACGVGLLALSATPQLHAPRRLRELMRIFDDVKAFSVDDPSIREHMPDRLLAVHQVETPQGLMRVYKALGS